MEKTDTISKLKLGFLGVGWIGRNRMEAVLKNTPSEAAAIADVSPELLEQARQICASARTGNNVEFLLDQQLDAVVIATPSALHAEQTIAALEKGYSVFCQKPLGRNLKETKEIVHAAEKNNKFLGVDFSYRYTSFKKLYDLVQNGELGDVYAVNLVFHNAYGPDKSWFYDPKLSGGGCVVDLGVHLVDLALWTLDFPEVDKVDSNLYCKGKPVVDDEQVEDFAAVSMTTASGTSIRMTCSWNLPAGRDAIIEATFYGTKGGASFRNVKGSFYDFIVEKYSGTATERIAEPENDWGGKAISNWVLELAKSNNFRKESYEYIKVAEVIDRIYKRN